MSAIDYSAKACRLRAEVADELHQYMRIARQDVPALCARIASLEAALRSTAQRHHLSSHSFKTNFDECGDEVCQRARAALGGGE